MLWWSNKPVASVESPRATRMTSKRRQRRITTVEHGVKSRPDFLPQDLNARASLAGAARAAGYDSSEG